MFSKGNTTSLKGTSLMSESYEMRSKGFNGQISYYFFFGR